jgi:hypothetical protein
VATKKKAARASPTVKRSAPKAEAAGPPHAERERRLTPKQQAFVGAYLANGCNASAAYREAYGAENMNQPTIAREASRLLQHPLIAPIVAAEREKLAQHHGVTPMIVRELALATPTCARLRVVGRNIEGQGGKVIVRGADEGCAALEIDDDTAAAISEISRRHGVRIVPRQGWRFKTRIACSGRGAEPDHYSVATEKGGGDERTSLCPPIAQVALRQGAGDHPLATRVEARPYQEECGTTWSGERTCGTDAGEMR